MSRRSPPSRTPRLWLWIGMLLAPGTLVAQEGVSDAPSSISLDSLLSVPVHGAALHAQTIAQAPASITIVTADDIGRFGYRTLADVLQRVRGFHLSTDRNYTALGVRGVGRPGDYSNRVVVLLDGHVVNDNVYGAAYAGDDLGIPLGEVERIEIIRGPGSALFGSGAMGAVIDIVTRSAAGPGASGEGRPSGAVAVDVGGDGFRQLEVRGSRGLLGLETRLAGRVGRSDGPDLYFDSFDDPDTNHGVAEGLDWEEHAGALFSARGEHLSLRARASTRTKGIPTAAFGIDFNHPLARTTDGFVSLEAGYRRRLGPSLSSQGRVSFDRFHYHGRYPYDGEEYYDRTVGERFGGEGFITWDPSPAHRIVVGADVEVSARSDYFAVYMDEVQYDGDHPYELFSGFIHDEVYLTSDLALTAGVRHDRYSFGRSMTTPRLALVYNPAPGTTLKTIYGEAFRAPNVYERLVELPDQSRANPSLRGEHLRSAEFIWEQRLGWPLFGTVSLYRNEVADLIDAILDEDDLQIFINAGEARVRGLEMELDARTPGGLSGYASWTFQDARDGEGRWLTNSPRRMGRLGASVPLRPTVWLAPEVRWESERRTVVGTESDGAALMRVSLTVQPRHDLRVSAVMDNLTDTVFHTPGALEHSMASIRQPGRLLRVRLEYRF